MKAERSGLRSGRCRRCRRWAPLDQKFKTAGTILHVRRILLVRPNPRPIALAGRQSQFSSRHAATGQKNHVSRPAATSPSCLSAIALLNSPCGSVLNEVCFAAVHDKSQNFLPGQQVDGPVDVFNGRFAGFHHKKNAVHKGGEGDGIGAGQDRWQVEKRINRSS